MTIPPPREILSAIRSSCQAASLPVDPHAIDAFISSVSESEWDALSVQHGVRLPLRFDSSRDELNLVATIGLLNFLSGYRTELHRLTGRGAYQTVLALVLAAYLSSSDSDSESILSAEGMSSATVTQVAALAQITTHRESDHPTLGPAVKVGTKDPDAFEILELVVAVLNQTGRTLLELNDKDLGTWVERELCRTQGDVGEMVHSMATTFPAFRDVQTLEDGTEVYLFKKALWTLHAIHARFAPSQSTSEPASPPTSFPVPTRVDEWPIFADNVLPSMFLHYKIISTPGPLSTTRSSPPNLPSPTVLRASAVHAARLVVERAHELAQTGGADRAWLHRWTEVGLDGYLWSLAKEGTRRQDVARVVQEKGTVYY